MIQSLVLQIISAIVGLWLAARFVSGVELVGPIQTLLLTGSILGLVNSFLKPIVKLITLPLRLLTLGLFSIVVNMAMVWLVDVFFPELIIEGIFPLFWTTLIIWSLSIFLSLFGKGKITA